MCHSLTGVLSHTVFMHLSNHKPSVSGRGYKQTYALFTVSYSLAVGRGEVASGETRNFWKPAKLAKNLLSTQQWYMYLYWCNIECVWEAGSFTILSTACHSQRQKVLQGTGLRAFNSLMQPPPPYILVFLGL